jgi:WhiB family redox-sensing transcriptional regulator
MADALCLEHPEVNFFSSRGESTTEAKRLCGRCLVQRECREYALADPDLMGVWGDTSQRDRARLRVGASRVTAA